MATVATGSRAQPRLDLEEAFAVQLSIESDDGRTEQIVTATVLNLSTSGAKLAVPLALKADKAFRLRLVVDLLGLNLYLSAKVCWSAPDGTDACVVGCRLSPTIPDGILQHIAAGGRLDRRDESRRSTAVEVQVVRSGKKRFFREFGTIRNYADGGLCLETTQPTIVGDVFELRPRDKGGDAIVVVARWVMQQGTEFLTGCEYAGPESRETALSTLA